MRWKRCAHSYAPEAVHTLLADVEGCVRLERSAHHVEGVFVLEAARTPMLEGVCARSGAHTCMRQKRSTPS